MAEKRVTMKDIARETGVSTATVSYVLNYSNKEKISHETRMKIFEAAHQLKYVPNMNARSLASQKSFLVGIIINMEIQNRKSKIYQYYDLAREIQRALYPLGYDILLMPTKEMEKDLSVGQKRSLDAVFIVDLDEEKFKLIANQFYVPALFIDGYVEDPIFCKIITDYERVMERAKELLGENFYVVLEDFSNKKVYDCITNYCLTEDIFINYYGANLIAFLQKHHNQKGLVMGEILGMQVENYVDNRNIAVVVGAESDVMLLPDTKRIVVSNREKAKRAVEIMLQLLQINNAEEVECVSYIGPKEIQ